MLRFGPHAHSTRLAILLDKFPETRPGIIPTNEFDCLVLTQMSRKYVIVLVMENTEMEIM